MKIAVVKCGKMTATMEMDAFGLVSITGKTAQKRGTQAEAIEIAELPLDAVMQLRDRNHRNTDEPLTDYVQSLVNEIWEQVAEDEPWFAFCAPNFANAEAE
jgi:hypothetical protein